MVNVASELLLPNDLIKRITVDSGRDVQCKNITLYAWEP